VRSLKSVTDALGRLLREDAGQDVIEYAFLAALVAVAAAETIHILETTLHDAYTRWDTDTQAIAMTPDPQ